MFILITYQTTENSRQLTVLLHTFTKSHFYSLIAKLLSEIDLYLSSFQTKQFRIKAYVQTKRFITENSI